MTQLDYDPRFPGIDDLRNRARKRIPRFAFEYLDGGISLEHAIELIKRNSRRYAKRQLTWFKRHPESI